MKESKTELAAHISKRGGRLSVPAKNWASLHVMNSMSAFPLQVLLIPKHSTPCMEQNLFSLLILLYPKNPEIKLGILVGFFSTGGSLVNYTMKCWQQPAWELLTGQRYLPLPQRQKQIQVM